LFVFATGSPREFAGAVPLREATRDGFLIHVRVGSRAREQEVVR
jgi:hypothetical protein